jgi:hypothetical protein
MGDPIWILCEGSGCTVHDSDGVVGMCQMCGQIVFVDGWRANPHERHDILAWEASR